MRRLLIVLAAVICASWGAQAAGNFDGTYKGSRKVLQGTDTARCNPGSTDSTFIVKDGQIKFTYDSGVMQVPVRGDGTFNASDFPPTGRYGTPVVVTLTGRIEGGKLEADYKGRWCAIHY